MDVVKLAIHGAAGRMGKRLVALSTSDPALRLVAAIEFQLKQAVPCIAASAC